MNSGNSINNQKVLGNCPACRGLMQIPVSTDVKALAKCPHCDATTPIRELLASLAPEAELINEPSRSAEVTYTADRQREYDVDRTPKRQEKFVVPKQLSDGASKRARKRHERQLKKNMLAGTKAEEVRDALSGSSRDRSRSAEKDRPAKESRSSAGRAKAPVAAGQPVKPAIPSTPRPRDAESQSRRGPVKSGDRSSAAKPSVSKQSVANRRDADHDDTEVSIVDVGKFIVGGLVAAPVAYLAVLWIIGVDPFGMAPAFEEISPSIIPPAMRADADSTPVIEPVVSSDSASGDRGSGLPLPNTNPDSVR